MMRKIPDSAWEIILNAELDDATPCDRCGTRKKLMVRRSLGANEQGVSGTVSTWRCPQCWEGVVVQETRAEDAD